MDGSTHTGTADPRLPSPTRTGRWWALPTSTTTASPTSSGGTRATGANMVWYMNGVTRTGSANLTPVADQTWKIVGTGDFNSDGKPDILWRNTATGQNSVWYMDGVTFTRCAHRYGGQPDMEIAGEGNYYTSSPQDFNNDGESRHPLAEHLHRRKHGLVHERSNAHRICRSDPVTDQNWKIVGVADFN